MQFQPLNSSALQRAEVRLMQVRLERKSETRRLEKLTAKLQAQLKLADGRVARSHPGA